MKTYTVKNDATDYGKFRANTMAEAVLMARKDADWSREYKEPVLLSTSPNYGKGGLGGKGGGGNGAADFSEFWYVKARGEFGVFRSDEA